MMIRFDRLTDDIYYKSTYCDPIYLKDFGVVDTDIYVCGDFGQIYFTKKIGDKSIRIAMSVPYLKRSIVPYTHVEYPCRTTVGVDWDQFRLKFHIALVKIYDATLDKIFF